MIAALRVVTSSLVVGHVAVLHGWISFHDTLITNQPLSTGSLGAVITSRDRPGAAWEAHATHDCASQNCQ